MKLYATITSERATKGQGGNEYLDIDIYTGSAKDSKHLATARVKVYEEKTYTAYELELIKADGHVIAQMRKEQTKGEKQKGE